jgi:hypothetical protein
MTVPLFEGTLKRQRVFYSLERCLGKKKNKPKGGKEDELAGQKRGS